MNNEPFIVASRGRNPENPSDRTVGAPTEQRLEPNSQGICNTLTTVLKDNYVAEPILFDRSGYVKKTDVANTLTAQNPTTTLGNHTPIIGIVEPQLKMAEVIGGIGEKKSNGGTQYYQQDRIYQGDIALAHPASIPGGSYRYAIDEPQRLRIRKLTPKECYRLMGFDDESFHKAEATCSNTQLYKQAGNSIVVDVLEHLFMNLKPYLYS